MAREMDKDEPIVPSWNGEAAGWPDYSRRVRLCFAQTPYGKRYTLGPKLVLKLRGKAWEIAAGIDHEFLETPSGAQYLLQYLKDKLGRLPVPDVGQHLDELFVRVKRHPGVDMITWCNQVREAYKKLQRALARTKPGVKTSSTQTDFASGSGFSDGSPAADESAETIQAGQSPGSRRSQKTPVREEDEDQGDEIPPGYEDHDTWSWSAWQDWDGWWGRHERSDWWRDDSWRREEEVQWEDVDGSLPEILPPEVLGWLLLKRSGLSSQSRLSIQAAAANSMKFEDVERAMRQQEDELMHQERTRGVHQKGQHRSYWIEHDGSWGLVLQDVDEMSQLKEDEVKWLDGSAFAATVLGSDETPSYEAESVWYSDGWHDWVWHEDEWHTPYGESWVAYSEMKPWLDVEDIAAVDSVAGKELEELFVNFQQKVRTFKEARDLVHQKGKNRGYYPFVSKGKQKGKGKSTKGQKSSPPQSAMVNFTKGKGSGSSQTPNSPGYTGCFICGDKGHDYKNCTKRGAQQSSSSAAKVVCYVEPVNEASDHFSGDVFMVSDAEVPKSAHTVPHQDFQRLILAAGGAEDPHRLGYAVLDTGATETVGSLEAIDYIMKQRIQRFGQEKVGVDVKRQKRFRFGNAQEMNAESYLLLPQRVNGVETSLGVYTLDVPGVPILLGVKTMEKLGAVISVAEKTLEFTKVFPGTKIKLVQGKNKHLLLDLCSDWNPLFFQEKGITNVHNPVFHMTEMDHACSEKGRAVDAEEPDVTTSSTHAFHEVHQHDVHVVETQSETCSEESAGPVLEEYILQHQSNVTVSQPDFSTQTGRDNVLQRDHPIDHGDVEGCQDGGQQDDPGRECSESQTDGDRPCGPQVEDSDKFGALRLGTHRVGKPSRSSPVPKAMLGVASSGTLRKGVSQWRQRTCCVADVHEMQTSADVLPDVGIHGGAQVCGSTRSRCREEVHQLRRDDRPSRVPHQVDRFGGSGRVDNEEVDPDPVTEEGLESHEPLGEPQGQWQGHDQGEGTTIPEEVGGPEFQRGLPECVQDRRNGPTRDAGESVRGMGEDHPMSDVPALIDDDALCSQELGNSVFTCVRSMSELEKEEIVRQLEESQGECDEAFATLSRFKCDLVEVCCSDESTLTATVLQEGGIAYRIGLGNNMDLTTSQGLERASEFASLVKPRWMWFSLPCGPTSPLQHLNQKTESQVRNLRKKIRQSKKLAKAGRRLLGEQINRGGDYAWEWPFPNDAWFFKDVREMFENLKTLNKSHCARLDGCQVGVVAKDTGKPMLKPWKIMSSSETMSKALSLRCCKDHEHDECMGHKRALQSGFYPQKMCRLVSKVILGRKFPGCSFHVSGFEPKEVFVSGDSKETEQPISEKELIQMKEAIRKLHVRSGHPSNRALATTLKSRGVDRRLVQLAYEHRCDDCKEVHLPVPHRNVTFHQTETLWHTLQVDIGQFPFEDIVVHVLFMIDEASRFLVAYELFRHNKHESRNATTQEVILALEQGWVQYHGLPNTLRSDPEGCFRGLDLDSWARSRGVELAPCPGEDHGQIGVVEATIGKIKQDARTFLRSQSCDPFVGVLQMVSAHNHLDRIGGLAPSQWAYGRLPSLGNRLFEGGNELPLHTTEGSLGSDLRANLDLRVKAEELYRRSQAVFKINRALNTKPRTYAVYLPGDLVYYRRYKTPLSQQPSHVGLDQAKLGLARWYGPARVLATETRSETDPPTRKPGSIVWVIAAGRLKRCSPHQLRHCSDRERIIAEASEAVTTPWSFNSLIHLLEKGQYEKYDDHVEDENNPVFREREERERARGRSRSRVRAASEKPKKQEKTPQRPQQDSEPKGQGQTEERKRGERRPKLEQEGAPATDRETKKKKTLGKDEVPVETPTFGEPSSGSAQRHGEPAGGSLMQHPPFVAAQKRAPDIGGAEIGVAEIEAILESQHSGEEEQELVSVFHVTIAMPETRKEAKDFSRSADAWVAAKLKKGSELKWNEIPKDRIQDFQQAKMKEINNWLREKAVKLASEKVPSERVVRMRWIYTIKSDNTAKARIVIIGYEDPDLGQLPTTSPTMSRRTRGLFLTTCAHRGWCTVKGDVRAAFLQGLESEKEREIFARPVRELSKQLGGGPNDYVQILKACYGLANAPAQWHSSVSTTLKECHFEQLETEPCCWRLMDRTGAQPQLIGLAVAHVDDFLMAGEETHPQWQRSISQFHSSYKWTPWEKDSYMHCGVQVVQRQDGSFTLNHSDYCSTIEPIKISRQRHGNDRCTNEEIQQLRGVLGALQWRAYQSGPQHGARLSQLQSQLASPTIQTIQETNKLVREVYNQRHIGLTYHRLQTPNPLDITFVAWTDAAVGNRRDMSSSGGYVIAASEKEISDGKQCPLNMISWKSGRLPRIARSSLSAEIQAFSIAEEELMYCRLEWLEMNGIDLPVRDPASIVKQSPGILVTDAKSLYDIVKKGPQTTSGLGLKEKYSVLDMLSVFQRLSKCQTVTRWVHSESQLADAMTKPLANSSLTRALISGTWTLVHDENFTSSKNLRKRAKMPAPPKDVGVSECTVILEPDLPPHAIFAHLIIG